MGIEEIRSNDLYKRIFITNHHSQSKSTDFRKPPKAEIRLNDLYKRIFITNHHFQSKSTDFRTPQKKLKKSDQMTFTSVFSSQTITFSQNQPILEKNPKNWRNPIK